MHEQPIEDHLEAEAEARSRGAFGGNPRGEGKLHRIMASYYKKERDRAEQALGDILDILLIDEVVADQLHQVLDRLKAHYERSETTR